MIQNNEESFHQLNQPSSLILPCLARVRWNRRNTIDNFNWNDELLISSSLKRSVSTNRILVHHLSSSQYPLDRLKGDKYSRNGHCGKVWMNGCSYFIFFSFHPHLQNRFKIRESFFLDLMKMKKSWRHSSNSFDGLTPSTFAEIAFPFKLLKGVLIERRFDFRIWLCSLKWIGT